MTDASDVDATHVEGHPARSIIPLAVALVCATLTTAACVLRAVELGQDWSFDTHSYHTVYAYATLFERDRVGTATMSLGAYFNPLLDLPLGWGVRNLDPRAVTAGLALVQSLALIGAAALPWHAITGRILPSVDGAMARRNVGLWVVAYAFGLVVAYGAGAQVQLGATFGDLTSVVPAILGVHLLVAWVWHPRDRLVAWAGVTCGVATGLKYTNGPAIVGGVAFVLAAAALSGTSDGRRRNVIGPVARYVLGAMGGFVVTAGPWAVGLWVRFGNPVFPFGGERLNPAMRTADGGYVDLGTHQFAMRSVGEYVTLPFRLLDRTSAITEFPARDARPLIGALCVVACVVLTVRRLHDSAGNSGGRGSDRAAVLAPAFAAAWSCTYVSWAYLFGNGRYLQLVELLTPTMVVITIAFASRHATCRSGLRTPAIASVVLGSLALFLMPHTVAPTWPRVSFADRWYTLDLSALPPLDDAMVIVPYEFEPLDFAAFALAPKSFARLHSVLIPTRLGQDEIERIGAFGGPLYSFQATDAGDANLAAAGLRRTGECHSVPLAQGAVYELCRLEPM